MEELKQINPATALSFSGHRPDRLPGNGDPNAPEAQKLIAALRKEITAAINEGMTSFLHGCMAGFDLFAIEQVIALKQQYPHIKLVSVAPYKAEFFSREKCWTPEWEKRAREVFRQQDIGVRLSESYRRGIYYERNDILIQYSSLLICYHDGGSGGTQHTVRKAREYGLIVRNLYEGVK